MAFHCCDLLLSTTLTNILFLTFFKIFLFLLVGSMCYCAYEYLCMCLYIYGKTVLVLMCTNICWVPKLTLGVPFHYCHLYWLRNNLTMNHEITVSSVLSPMFWDYRQLSDLPDFAWVLIFWTEIKWTPSSLLGQVVSINGVSYFSSMHLKAYGCVTVCCCTCYPRTVQCEIQAQGCPWPSDFSI